MTEWQPIETAPWHKSFIGRKIEIINLLTARGSQRQGEKRYLRRTTWRSKDGRGFECPSGQPWEPTEWKPL